MSHIQEIGDVPSSLVRDNVMLRKRCTSAAEVDLILYGTYEIFMKDAHPKYKMPHLISYERQVASPDFLDM
jgi:hypothetical protein